MEIVNKILKLSTILGIISVCCGLFGGIELLEKKTSYISVNGLADKVIKSNEVTLSISFAVEGNKLSDIRSSLSNSTNEVMNFLHKYGFTDNEIVSSSDDITDRLSDRYAKYVNASAEKPENRYSLSRKIILKSKQVDAARQLNSHLVDLYEKDICAHVATYYHSTDFEKIRLDLLSEAVKDARVRAEKIANTAGIKISGVQSIATGRFVVLDADRVTSDYWSSGEESYLKRYRIIVTVSFNKK